MMMSFFTCYLICKLIVFQVDSIICCIHFKDYFTVSFCNFISSIYALIRPIYEYQICDLITISKTEKIMKCGSE